MKRIILITGASGSGGSYLAEHILKKKNSQVIGLIRNKKKRQSYNLKILKKYKNFNTKICNLNNIKKLVTTI